MAQYTLQVIVTCDESEITDITDELWDVYGVTQVDIDEVNE